MIISLNTKEDSHEDIKRVIAMLQHLVGENAEAVAIEVPASSSEITPASTENIDSSANVMSMFSENPEQSVDELLKKAEEIKVEQGKDKIQLEEYF